MTLPSKSKQVEAVQALLDAALDREDFTTEDLATEIVNGYHKLLTSGVKKPVTYPHVGLAFKTPFASKVYHVAYDMCDLVWVVSADSRHGDFIRKDDPFWSRVEHSTAKSGAPGNNKNWTVGEFVTRSWGMEHFKIVATGDKCVLLQDCTDDISAESNDNMEKYYKKERR